MHKKLTVGDQVTIKTGLLKGCTGILVAVKEWHELPYLIRINNNRRCVRYTAHEIRGK